MGSALDRLTKALSHFHDFVELPKLSRLTPKLMFEFTEQALWAEKYHAGPALAGCYVLETEGEEFVYIGSVSANGDFGRRFAGSYFRRNPNDQSLYEKLGHAIHAKRIYVVDLPNDHSFLAPAIEQFLISYFKPRLNAKDCGDALRKRLIQEGRIAMDL